MMGKESAKSYFSGLIICFMEKKTFDALIRNRGMEIVRVFLGKAIISGGLHIR